MNKRTNNFILLNDKQILTGDITITRKLLINNGSLIVYGNLIIDGDIEISLKMEYKNLLALDNVKEIFETSVILRLQVPAAGGNDEAISSPVYVLFTSIS